MKPRKNASAVELQKKNVAKRRAQKPEESDSDYSDSSSDSDYEEILISSMKKAAIKKEEPKSETKSEPKSETKSEPKPEPPNHANHFTEEKIKPKSKNKSRVVIKKYYNYKPKSERKKDEKKSIPLKHTEHTKPTAKPEVKPKPETQPQQIKPRSSYIGIGNRNNPTVNMSNRLSHRILNW